MDKFHEKPWLIKTDLYIKCEQSWITKRNWAYNLFIYLFLSLWVQKTSFKKFTYVSIIVFVIIYFIAFKIIILKVLFFLCEFV